MKNNRSNGLNTGMYKKGGPKAPKSASQYKARTNFLLEHLASFTMKTNQDIQMPAKERLAQTKDLLAKGNLWTKEMEMRLTDHDIVLLDGETQGVIEVYPLSSISLVQHIDEDIDLNSVLLFTTNQTEDKYAATHLFQSDRVPATVVATEIMKASSSKSAMPNRPQPIKNGTSLPPPPSYNAPQPPATLERERMDLHERSLVAQTIAAFSAASEESVKRPGKNPKVSQGDSESLEDAIPLDVLEARTNRDVQILNHCIDDIESLVWRTKKSAEAWKKLQKKKGKIKPESPLAIEARPPPDSDFIDAFQKFKHAFNLLGRLRPHIHNPNAAELVHYLFVPLSLLVRCTNGPEKAYGVLSPLLYTQAVELLQNCLSSKEMELWAALGPNWTDTKQTKRFKDQFIPPYAPVFKDGWVPPEFVGNRDVPANISAAVAATAAAVAQMNDQKKTDDSGSTSPTVLAAAAKFRRLTTNKREAAISKPQKKIFKRGQVVYDFAARNSKELTVTQGDELAILDDSRQWWCVRNMNGEIGFIPNTVVEKEQENALPSPPSIAPPPIPSMAVTNVQVRKIETTETKLLSAEERKVPFVELRRVNKKPEEDTGPTPPPPPPMSPPPPTAPPVSPIRVTQTRTGRTENGEEQVSQLEKAILNGGNLRKVDKKAEQKKREQLQQNRMSSADMLTDELKRRMTHGQTTLTPRVTRKSGQDEAVLLIPESTPTEVREWLKSKNFSQKCVQALAWTSVKDLEKLSKEDLKRKCGDAEGARVYSQFAVQKSSWTTSAKGSELNFIMRRRKEMADTEAAEEPSVDGQLRSIVSQAKSAADNEVFESQEITKHSYTGKKPVMVTAPQERTRPQSMIVESKSAPDVRTRSSSHRTPPAIRKKTRGSSFGSEFIPPPPVDYNDQQVKQENVLTSEQVEAILIEQKKQQELLREHEKQLALMDRLQIQKRELEEHKKEYEELQKRQKQNALEEKQKELEKQIRAQQDELKANQTRLEQQNQYLGTMPMAGMPMAGMNNMAGMNMAGMNMAGMNMAGMSGMMMQPRQIPVMSPQIHMVPVSGVPAQPNYAASGLQMAPMPQGMQQYVGYTPAMTQTQMPQVVTTVPFSTTIPQ